MRKRFALSAAAGALGCVTGGWISMAREPGGATAPGTAWLGPDVLWRSRDHLVFHLQDPLGDGFRLTLTVRDMNTYCEGERPVAIVVIGPSGDTLAVHEIPDDGVVAGNAMWRDGIDDVWLDYRYRGWHLAHSPGGMPPGKSRSPFLAHPERLLARSVEIDVRPDGKGLYRVLLAGSWDHWFSLTPDRPIPAGIHSGAGPLYVHGDRLREAWLYAPPGTRDIGIMLSEEIKPFNWTVELADEQGASLAGTTPREFINFLIHRDARPDAYYRIRAAGSTTGACLAVNGIPALFAPDLATARLLRGGLEVDARGRTSFHGSQKRLLAWMDALSPGDLEVPAGPPARPDLVLKNDWEGRATLADVQRLLDRQDLDPESPTFGQFLPDEEEAFERRFTFWMQKADMVAKAAALADPGNPYHAHPGVVRRVLLARIPELMTLNGYLWFGAGADAPRRFKEAPESFFDIPYRSQWVPMHDARHVISFGHVRPFLETALPAGVIAAWKNLFLQWAYGKTQFEQGICSNQWCSIMGGVAMVAAELDDPAVWRILRNQITRITTRGNAGRFSPDPGPYGVRSSLAYSLAADRGYVGAGFLTDGGGHDNQYNLETESHLAGIHRLAPHEGIVDYLNDYYILKTHLSLPKWGVFPSNPFAEIASPTDSNHRTRFFTHKSGLGDPDGELRARVKYGDLWAGRENPLYTWPSLETEPFVRNLDNMYFFINTPGYYAIAYGGSPNNAWETFGLSEIRGGSLRLVGYFGMHYGGLGRMPTKVGGLSAVFVRGCGPTLLSWNHNVMYSNVVWGRRRKPIAERCNPDVDPLIFCSGYSQSHVSLDETGRALTRIEPVPDVPLEVRRLAIFRDDRIEVTTEIIALEDVDLIELYECVPYFVDRRIITLYGGTLEEGRRFAVPDVLESPTYVFRDGIYTGENPALPEETFRAFTIAAANGAGSTVIFDRERRFKQTQPQTYGNATSAFAAFNAVLSPRMRAGERQVVRYVILSHDREASPAALRAAAP